MSDCDTGDYNGHIRESATIPLSRPASWRDYEEYERWLATDAARLTALRELPQHLTVRAAADFLRLDVADVRLGIEVGELDAVTVNGEKYVITRSLLADLGVRLEEPGQ